jgi:hypothetical protein
MVELGELKLVEIVKREDMLPHIEDMEEKINKKIELMRIEIERKTNIFCPFCDRQQDNETKYRYVSYWGEDGTKGCTCEACDKKFFVEEKVTREFICTKTEDEDE